MKNVLVLGKFRPMHIGHEAMIEFAQDFAGKNGKVQLLIADHDETFTQRVNILTKKYKKNKKVNVKSLWDKNYQGVEFDDNGTCLDNGFMEKWATAIKMIFSSTVFTHIVSSDLYGKELAKALGVKWIPFDPDRELFPISGTEIRENVQHHWDKIVPEFRQLYGISICVVGPESTGKSTLVKNLTKVYDLMHNHIGYVPEYGRIYSDHKVGDWFMGDFHNITVGQRKMIESAQKQNILTFIDTEAYTTHLFGELYLHNRMKIIEELAAKQRFTHYLLLKPNVRWVQDGQRILEKREDRDAFFNRMKDFLDENNFPYTIIDAQSWNYRLYASIKIVDKVIDEKLGTLEY